MVSTILYCMDFATVLNKLTNWFDENDVGNAIIGGFALAIHGVVRGTNDLDYLLDSQALPSLKEFLATLNYKIIYESENIIQFQNDLGDYGSLDFLLAFRETSLNMLKRAEKHMVFNETISVNVVRPEDLIGLKLQALCNDSRREAFDMQDICELLDVDHTNYDWKIIKQHFELFDKLDVYNVLKEQCES